MTKLHRRRTQTSKQEKQQTVMSLIFFQINTIFLYSSTPATTQILCIGALLEQIQYHPTPLRYPCYFSQSCPPS